VILELQRRMDTPTGLQSCIIVHYSDVWAFVCLDEACCGAQWDILNQIVCNPDYVNLAIGVLIHNKDVSTCEASIATTIHETADQGCYSACLVGSIGHRGAVGLTHIREHWWSTVRVVYLQSLLNLART
jgi:hypothetical protein